MQIGGIYKGKNKFRERNVYHYVVCLERVAPFKRHFNACILTHSNKCEGDRRNILMDKEHFLTEDENGKQYKFQYDNTHIVQQVYRKEVFWIKDRCVGKLSKQGLRFVLQHKEEFGPSIWFKKRLGKRR